MFASDRQFVRNFGVAYIEKLAIMRKKDRKLKQEE